jgi:hypothetical protein
MEAGPARFSIGMENQRPRYVLQREIVAIQVFGRYLLEKIPPGSMILVSGHTTRERMLVVLWEDREYIMFERDLKERATPVGQQKDEDPAEPLRALLERFHPPTANVPHQFHLVRVVLKLYPRNIIPMQNRFVRAVVSTRFGCQERTGWFSEGSFEAVEAMKDSVHQQTDMVRVDWEERDEEKES